MNKLIDLIYIAICLYYLIPIFNKVLKDMSFDDKYQKIFFIVSVLFLEIIFYTTSKYLRKHKIDFVSLLDITLVNSLLYLLGFCLVNDLDKEINQYIESNNKDFTYLVKILFIISPNLIFSIIKPLLKLY